MKEVTSDIQCPMIDLIWPGFVLPCAEDQRACRDVAILPNHRSTRLPLKTVKETRVQAYSGSTSNVDIVSWWAWFTQSSNLSPWRNLISWWLVGMVVIYFWLVKQRPACGEQLKKRHCTTIVLCNHDNILAILESCSETCADRYLSRRPHFGNSQKKTHNRKKNITMGLQSLFQMPLVTYKYGLDYVHVEQKGSWPPSPIGVTDSNDRRINCACSRWYHRYNSEHVKMIFFFKKLQ